METAFAVLGQLAQVALFSIGLLTVIAFGVRQILDMLSRQTELSGLDAQIKTSLRESLAIEVQRRETVEKESAQQIQSLFTQVEEVNERLGENAVELKSARVMSGTAIIAADVALGYGSFKLQQIHEAEAAFVKGLHDRLAAALFPSLAALVSATSREEKGRAIIEAGRLISDAYSTAVFEAVRLGQDGRRTAGLLASFVPVAVEESWKFSETTPSTEIISVVWDRMAREGLPLGGDGSRRGAFLRGEDGTAQPAQGDG